MAGVVISILLLWWALHGVALGDVLSHLRRARPIPFALAVGLATLSFPVRTIRWQYLLQQGSRRIAFLPLWHATAVGFMANNLLPARAGEVARGYTVHRLTGVRFSAALASLAVERVLDGLVLVGLLALAIARGGLQRGTTVGGIPLSRVAEVGMGLFVPALLLAFWLVHWPGPALRTASWMFHRLLPGAWAARLLSVVEGLLAGLDALRSPRRFALVVFWSLAVWLISGAAYWAGFVALGVDVPAWAALLLQSLVAFGVAIPSSPGFFGPFEAVTRAVLTLYAVPVSLAVSYAIAFHLAWFIPISALGLWSLSRAHLRITELTRSARAQGAP